MSLWTVACQPPLSMGFPRQEYGNGCHFLLQGIFPTPGRELLSLESLALAGRFFTTGATCEFCTISGGHTSGPIKTRFRTSVRGSTLTENRPPWPGTIVTICMSCFMTGGPGKQQGTNKPPPTGGVQERSKGDTTCPTSSHNPSLWHPFWLSKACTTRKDSESE